MTPTEALRLLHDAASAVRDFAPESLERDDLDLALLRAAGVMRAMAQPAEGVEWVCERGDHTAVVDDTLLAVWNARAGGWQWRTWKAGKPERRGECGTLDDAKASAVAAARGQR
jgi:hypothetical protein